MQELLNDFVELIGWFLRSSQEGEALCRQIHGREDIRHSICNADLFVIDILCCNQLGTDAGTGGYKDIASLRRGRRYFMETSISPYCRKSKPNITFVEHSLLFAF